ncbi:MAG: ATP-grasp fold amidoligase family protein [Lachnospiraceae bacterium]
MRNFKQKMKRMYWVSKIYFIIRYVLPAIFLGDKRLIQKKFRTQMGFIPDLENPKTLNEKIQWLKLNDRKDFYTMVADKYAVRKYYADEFGEEYVVPLLKKFDSWKDITFENLPDEPFVIKANTGTGTLQIVRDKKEINISKLRVDARKWMNFNHYYRSQEWQYKNIKPCIIVEKLLQDANGKIPNDYKLHYFNGELQFIYCVVDREGVDCRSMYSPEWKQLPFQWISVKNHNIMNYTMEAPRPQNLDKMILFGNKISKNFKYVRVDYYEVNGKLYFGEITLYHGSGMNKFYPAESEKIYANKLRL